MARNFSSTLSSGTCLRRLAIRVFPLICFLFLISGIVNAYETTTAYLKEMPAVAAVERDISGSNADDARLRQIGAFKQLMRMINDVMCGDRAFELSKAEQQKVREYHEAEMALMATMNAAGAKYNPDQYAFDKTLEGELFRLYFSDSWQQEYHSNLALKAKEAAQFEVDQQKRVEEADQYWKERQQESIRQAPQAMKNQLLRLRTPLLLSIITVGLLFIITRRWRKVKFYPSSDANTPVSFKYGKHYVQIDYLQGMVSDFKKESAKRVEGTHGVVLTSKVSVEFFLHGLDGSERPISMVSMDLSARDGHVVTLAGYFHGQDFIPLAARNHTTNLDYYHQDNLEVLFLGPKLQTIGCGLTGGMIVGLAGVWFSIGDKTGLYVLWLVFWIGLGLVSGLLAPKAPDPAAIREFKKALTFQELPFRAAE